jgi:hypothetical protein
MAGAGQTPFWQTPAYGRKFPPLELEFLPEDVRVIPKYRYASTDLRYTDAIYNDPRHSPSFHTRTDASKHRSMVRYHNAILKFFRAGPTSDAGRVSMDVVVKGVRDCVKGMAEFDDDWVDKKSLASALRKCTTKRVMKALIGQFVFHFKAAGMSDKVLSVVRKGWARFYIHDEDRFWYELVEEVTGIECT